MAPEQVEGRILDVDASTDQFALGVIAQELLTGRNPFAADSVAAIFSRVSSAPPMPVGHGQDVDAVLARALAKSSRLRFRSVTDFAEAFRAAALAWARANRPLVDLPATDGRTHVPERKPRLRQPNWRVALGAAAMAVAMFLVADTRPNLFLTARRTWSATVAEKFRPDSGERDQSSANRLDTRPVVHAEPAPQVTVLTVAAEPIRQTDSNASSHARTRPPVSTRPASHAAASRPRSALTVDDDATMPPTEFAGNETNP
jgi:serine/threonine protein kinase